MMQLIVLLLTLLVSINRPVASAIVLVDFQQQALTQHNYLRQLHCTGSLTPNSTLNNIAQSYAEYLAANRIFAHSNSGLGENLWAMFSSNPITFVNGSTPTYSWYNEIFLYSYSSPGFSSSTGHFTQVVWKGATQFGIGIALTDDNKSAYVVANYYRPGNVLGSFPANVLPLCSATTTITTTIPTTTTTIPTETITTTIPTTTTTIPTKTITTTIPTTTVSTTSKATTTTRKTTTTTRKTTTTRRRRGRAIIES